MSKSKSLKTDITTKLRKITKVSKRVRLEMVRDALGMDGLGFNQKIFDWAEEFGFTIDGDFVDFSGSDVDAFVKSLDAQFAAWGTSEHSKSGKADKISPPVEQHAAVPDVPPKNPARAMFEENVHQQVLQISSSLDQIMRDFGGLTVEIRRGLHNLKYIIPLKKYGDGKFYKILKWGGRSPFIRITDYERLPCPPEPFKHERARGYNSPDPNAYGGEIRAARVGPREIMTLIGRRHFFLEGDSDLGPQLTPESAELLSKNTPLWDERVRHIKSMISGLTERIGNYQNEDRSLFLHNPSITAEAVENGVQRLDTLRNRSQELLVQVEALRTKYHGNKNAPIPGVKKTRRGKRG